MMEVKSPDGEVYVDAHSQVNKNQYAKKGALYMNSIISNNRDANPNKIDIGSMVEVETPNLSDKVCGVIRWIGIPPGMENIMVGIELEDVLQNDFMLSTNGTFNGIRLFECPEYRAIFVPPENCLVDRRFSDNEYPIDSEKVPNCNRLEIQFGKLNCPSITGAVPPLRSLNMEELETICGKFRGIQGHHNSCYLDSTLFAMFTFTTAFDSILFRPPRENDIGNYLEVQSVLRDEIVNPLRKHLFVRADRVMKLRQLLDKLSSIKGLTNEEKDPEEFLNSLLLQIMRVDPFLKLDSGQDSIFYQLFVEKDDKISFPSVQQLFDQSFYTSNIKLKEVPACMIIQMPRFGKDYKLYPYILPSQVLDITDIIDDSPRQCTVCGKLAEKECRDCFGSMQGNFGLESTAFCTDCYRTVHMHFKRANHSSTLLCIPQDFKVMSDHMVVPRIYMELFAVVCIETSHYVSFVKAGSGPDAPWCFFDSMADRKGEQDGYNIPEIIPIPDLHNWLSEEGSRTFIESSLDDKKNSEHSKRLFCDAYLCMYQSSEVVMYR